MQSSDHRDGSKRRNASALIVVLWVVGMLSLLMSSLAFDAHIEARITSYYRKRTQSQYLAVSGIEVAELLMSKIGDVKGKPADPLAEEEDPRLAPARRLSQGLAVRGLEEKLGYGTITLDIVPEPARRNINKLGKSDAEKTDNLERIFNVAGIPEELWPVMIDSFLDWTDKNNARRLDGAETEDYEDGEGPPFQAKNGPLDTVGEMALINGFRPVMLTGGEIRLDEEDENEEPIRISGMEDLLTTYGDGKVNVNAAPMRVLMTLPDVDELVAGAIIEEREGWLDETGEQEDTHFRDVNQLYARIPDMSPTARNMITTDSQIFRITSVGTLYGVSVRVWCIATYSGRGLKIVRWREGD